MKKLLITSVFIGLLTGVFSQQVQHVDAATFKQLIEKGDGMLLDVRTPNEFNNSHITGATLMNMADSNFYARLKLIQRDLPVYLYCLVGSRSAKAALWMVQNGFKNVYNLQKGIRDWTLNGFPVEKGNNVVASLSPKYSQDTLNKILKTKKVVLLDFYAPWCGPCKKMMPDIEKLSETYKGKAEIVKMDIEANDSLSRFYNVQTLPVLILFSKGKQVFRKDGMMKYDEIVAEMKKYL